jgi:hypothetical protein
VVNRELGPLSFEGGQPSNGAAYMTAMLQARARIVEDGRLAKKSPQQIEAAVRDPGNYPYPFMPARNFDGDFLVHHGDDLTRLVLPIEADASSDLRPLAKAAADHLRRQLGIRP